MSVKGEQDLDMKSERLVHYLLTEGRITSSSAIYFIGIPLLMLACQVRWGMSGNT